jgi:hypothetical protein
MRAEVPVVDFDKTLENIIWYITGAIKISIPVLVNVLKTGVRDITMTKID